MLIVDIIILILLLGFFIRGWQSGLIKMAAGLIGIVAGIIVAGHFFPVVAEWLMQFDMLAGKENVAKIAAIVVIFLAVNGIIGVGAAMIDKMFHIFSFIPFLKTINRLTGAVLGLLGGAFIFGFLIIMIDKFPLAEFITKYFEGSVVVPYLVIAADMITPLWPEAVKQVKGIIDLK